MAKASETTDTDTQGIPISVVSGFSFACYSSRSKTELLQMS